MEGAVAIFRGIAVAVAVAVAATKTVVAALTSSDEDIQCVDHQWIAFMTWNEFKQPPCLPVQLASRR